MESRTPPQNLEAEQSVLGSVLLDNDTYPAIEGVIQAEHFYKESHRKIFRAIERLFRRSEPMDLVTLTEELRQSGELEGVGSVPYLIGLADSVPTAAYAETYARIVVEKATLRDLISASGQIMQSAYDQAMPLEQILDKAEASIFEMSSSKRSHHFQGMSGLVGDTFQYINELFANPDPVSGLRTGFRELDVLTAGLQPSSLNVLAARPAMGKCLGRGTLVVMRDGNLRAVEALQIGDELLGPDSRPRRILSLARGREAMYWVRQCRGVDYRVNASHILSLKRSRAPQHGTVVNLCAQDYLALGSKAQSDLKGYKVAIELPERPLSVEPYFLGLWLGDGGTEKVGVTTRDAAVVAYLQGYAERLGMTVTVDTGGGARCPTYAITSAQQGGSAAKRQASLQGQLRALGVLGDKHIPEDYLLNSRANRLELLAGLIASDGHHPTGQTGPYEITTKLPELAKQIKYLCDSLGYATSLSSKTAALGDYRCEVFRVRFSGNVDEIPVGVARKRAKPWTCPKDWRLTAIRLEPDGVDEYYGFTLGGDGLFLLEDMTVTHNTAFALTIAQNVALKEHKPVGIFNLEMSAVQLVTRMLCSEARVDMNRVRNGQLSDRDFQRLADTAGRLSECKIFIDDNADLTVMELRSRARRLMAEHGLGLIVIDYLQLMSGGNRFGGGENRQQEISTISRGLKLLARELDVPVLALSQLSRAVESRPNKRPLLSDLRESGCLAGDSLVTLADTGERVMIRELVGRTDFAVWALEPGTFRLQPATVSRAFATGHHTVYRLRTRSGRSVRATANHKFLTPLGWKRLDELAVGEHVALPRRLGQPSHASLSLDELALLGHLLGDGCTLPGHALQYTTRDADLAAEVAALAVAVFGEAVAPRVSREAPKTRHSSWFQVYLSSTRHHTHGIRNAVAEWLEQLGVWGLRSFEKRVPEAVFSQPTDHLGHFLRHLWATDGCVHLSLRGRAYPAVYYASSSKRLAEDVQALLLRVGVQSRLRRVPQRGGRDQYHVVVSGRTDLLRFAVRVGAVGERKQTALGEVCRHLAGRAENTNRDVVPRDVWKHLVVPAAIEAGLSTRQLQMKLDMAYCGSALYKNHLSRARTARVAAVVGCAALAALAESDVYWDEVAALEDDGYEEVYDLTVPGPHNFVANDLVVHNSIEQDADLVMFIYRDEYYDPNSEKQGVAEVIIGKQRNGPVGTAELQFHNAHVRFNDLAKPV